MQANIMKVKPALFGLAAILIAVSTYPGDASAPPKENVFETRPFGIKISVKMVGPYMEDADLQIICLFKHKPTGDTYLGAAKDSDAHLGGLLSALRNRGEFVGELGETILFTPPKGSMPAKRFMVIGLGDESEMKHYESEACTIWSGCDSHCDKHVCRGRIGASEGERF